MSSNLDGDLTLELDPAESVIRLKALAAFDDPVELSCADARELAMQLLELAERIE